MLKIYKLYVCEAHTVGKIEERQKTLVMYIQLLT